MNKIAHAVKDFDLVDRTTADMRRLTELVSKQDNLPWHKARDEAASLAAVPPGTFFNLDKERRKTGDLSLFASTRLALIKYIEQVLYELQNELEAAKLTSPRMDCVEVTMAEARLAQGIAEAKEILGGNLT